MQPWVPSGEYGLLVLGDYPVRMHNSFGSLGMFGVGFVVVFAFIIAVIVAIVVMLVRQTTRVSRQRAVVAAAPEVQAQVRVIDKRVDQLGPGNADAADLASPNLVRVPMGDDSVYQLHRITFEQPGGERFELSVPASQYGLIVEGDTGTVTMKGPELLSFAREIMR